MANSWDNNGQPLADGRLCLVIDPEDGSHKLRIYGMTKEEVLDKAAKTIEHGQRTIAALRNTAQPAAQPAPRVTPAPAPARVISADDQMRATADLSNPATAPRAVATLLEAATGMSMEELKRPVTERRNEQILLRLADIASAWQQTHPEFPDHPANKKMIMDSAALKVGAQNITADALEQAYQSLVEAGMLVSAAEVRAPQEPQQAPLPPGESLEAGNVRQTRTATTHRSSSLRGSAPVATTAPTRYTRAQIDAMPSEVLERKITTEPGFKELLNQFAQPRRSA